MEGKIGRIIVEENAIQHLKEEVKRLNPSKVCVVTDKNVGKIWFENIFKEIGLKEVEKFEIDAGEKGKSLNTASRLWKKLIEGKYTRKSLIIALGGGVVGDVTGFVASTFMRGTYFAQIPTTLLAQVDSSIGGKNGINFHGKNMIGTFYQPSFTIVDTKFIETLPENEFLNGIAEIIKYGIIFDRKFFYFIKENIETLKKKESDILQKIVEKCVEMKVEIVVKDEREEGLRRILNFGHTFGHAIEKLSNYRIKHGFAVSIGMVMACKVAEKVTGFKQVNDVKELLEKTGLPTSTKIHIDKIVEEMVRDKKAWYGKIVLILPQEIGKVTIQEVEKDEVLNTLKDGA
ncbi:MAG: 3-dehydroquinate synthase [Nitrososphaeria archaeon]|nr:3-dehydroquinate synthase [Nitrososphaeria archaeon]